jgi:hypothetical protein
MGKNNLSERLSCTKETKSLIMDECVKEFLKNNPKFECINITHNFILNRIAKYYLDKLN